MAHLFRFFASEPQAIGPGTTVALDPTDAHHLARVLRLQVGDPVELSDGAGGLWSGEVADPRAGLLRIGAPLPAPAPLVPIRVLIAQSGPRADDAVEKLVELGVTEIRPLLASGRRRDARIDRWQRIARGAAMQAKLGRIPAIGEALAFADALAPGAIVCSHEQADTDLDAALARIVDAVTLLVGPEAGFTDDELARARAAGVPIVSLGATVLRTETAAIVAAALVRARLQG